ncbi:hypothetical protein C8J56DRAFT_1171568 [Mycena floridula]|nr:hypothetical protein C8J56DRAFT_1171568 [Mycena floridula]
MSDEIWSKPTEIDRAVPTLLCPRTIVGGAFSRPVYSMSKPTSVSTLSSPKALPSQALTTDVSSVPHLSLPVGEDTLLARVKTFLARPTSERVLKAPCTMAQFERLQAALQEQGCGDLEKTKLQLIDDILIVEFPSQQHESVATYLDGAFRDQVFNTKGHADLRLTRSADSKGDATLLTPDFGIGDFRPEAMAANPNPTIILETACTQSLKDVREKAARYLLLDGHGARLVIVVDFKTKPPNTLPTMENIVTVTWENWRFLDKTPSTDQFSGLQACAFDEDDASSVVAYAVVLGKERVVACRTDYYQIYPHDLQSEKADIPILQLDAYRTSLTPEAVLFSVNIKDLAAHLVAAIHSAAIIPGPNILKRSTDAAFDEAARTRISTALVKKARFIYR